MRKRFSYVFYVGLMAILLISSGVLFAQGVTAVEKPKEPIELVILSHAVHQQTMSGNGGKDLIKEFIETHPNVKSVQFITAGTPQVGDRLFREVALPTTSIDVAFAYSPWLTPKITNFFIPIEDFTATKPLEDEDDFIDSFFEQVTFNGKRYGVPMRTSGGSFIFFNKKILAERGVQPPTTMEELFEAIKATSFTRANGEKVYGFVQQGNKAEITYALGGFMRAMDVDLITTDYKSNLTHPDVIKIVQAFSDLYKAGALPENFTALTNADVIALFQDNRAAFTKKDPDYINRLFKAGSLEKSDIGYIQFPPQASDLTKWDGVVPQETFQWVMAVPKGSQHKEEAWDFIRFMSSKDAVINEALSGNTPPRISTFADPRYIAKVPYAAEQLEMFKMGRSMFPAFDNYTEVNDIIGEYMQEAVLGKVSAQDAMKAADARIKPLL